MGLADPCFSHRICRFLLQDLLACTYCADLDHASHAVTLIGSLGFTRKYGPSLGMCLLVCILATFVRPHFRTPSEEHGMGTYQSWILVRLCVAAPKNEGYKWVLTFNPDPPMHFV